MNHQNLQKRTSSAENDNVESECKQEQAKQTGSTFQGHGCTIRPDTIIDHIQLKDNLIEYR